MKSQFAILAALLSLTSTSAIANDTAQAPSQEPSIQQAGRSDAVRSFVAKILGSTEVRWTEIFRERGIDYRATKLVLYSGQTGSACGVVMVAKGPRYCGSDQQIYLDPAFFENFGVVDCAGTKGCELARALVIAREVGHHVQHLLNISAKTSQMTARGDLSSPQAADIARRSELQADCFAGVWANRANRDGSVIDKDEVEPSLNVLTSLYTQLAGLANGFGTDGDRKRWFQNGYAHGQVADCNTFASP